MSSYARNPPASAHRSCAGARDKQTRLRQACLLAALLVFAGSSGCVHRRLTIRSDPPGALVYIDNYEIGTTPVSTDYIYYGTREIRLVKDGYETLTVKRSITLPWYQVFPLDFVTENLIPFNIRDERTLDFALAPQMMVPQEQLLGRAENLRGSSPAAAVAPVLAQPPPGAAPPGGLPPGATIPPGAIPPGGPFPPGVPYPDPRLPPAGTFPPGSCGPPGCAPGAGPVMELLPPVRPTPFMPGTLPAPYGQR